MKTWPSTSAREWVSVSTVTYMANEIIKRAVDGSTDDVVNSVDWVIVPNVNPDGYEYTFTRDRLWRKTRSKTSNRRCFGAGIYKLTIYPSSILTCELLPDPNRNWDYKWGGKGTSGDPCEDTYRGSKPASEPEVAATQKYIYNMKDRIKLLISFHSFSQLLMYPWAYDDVEIEDKDDLVKVANEGAAALEAVHGTQFRVGTVPQLLYPGTRCFFKFDILSQMTARSKGQCFFLI